MNIEAIKQQLIQHEGLRLKPYHCPANRLTIGVGRNLEARGISKEEAMILLENDINRCINDLRSILPGFNELSEVRQRVMVDMRFNLGPSGFRRFRRMIAAVNACDFEQAAMEMQRSIWYDQVGERAMELVKLMREG